LIRVLLVFTDPKEIAALRRAFAASAEPVEAGQAESVPEALSALVAAPFDFVVAQVDAEGGGAGEIAMRYPIVPCLAVYREATRTLLEDALDKGAVDYMDGDSPKWKKELAPYLRRLLRIRHRLAIESSHVAKRYEDLVEALPDVIYELDVDGKFTFVNQAVKFLGYTPEELIGKHFSAILFEEDVPHVSRDQVLPLYNKNRTGSRNAPKLFDERRGVDRKTENLELRIRRHKGADSMGKELIASVISYGEIASAGAYRAIGDIKEKVFVGTVGIIRDITLRRKSEDMLRKMYQAVDQSPVAVAVLDREMVIEYVNPAFFSMTGSGPDQAIGRKVGEYLGEASDPGTYDDLVTSIRSGIDWKGDLRCPRIGSDPFWSSVLVSTIRSPSGGVTHYLCLMEDISRKRTLDDLLRRAKESAEDASRAKSEFLANMSHELRTPLAGIISLSEVLLSDRPQDRQIDRLTGVQQSAKSLLSILNDLLDLSKIEARAVDIKHEDFTIKECVDETLLSFKALAADKGLSFQYTVDDGGFPQVNTDKGRLCQIISNLVSNAVKFTEQGGVDVRCSIRAKDDMPAIFVSVRDTGIGISGMDQQKLFKHFSQIDNALSKKYAGTGLGLAISRELVLKLGGDISVESTPGMGSTFSFYIPIAAPGTIEPELDDMPNSASRKLSLLVAEDNPVNRDYLRFILEKVGHRVETVADGLSVLQNLEKGDFDAILMDIQMPGMDGISATNTIRTYTGIGFDPRIPVIALTAYNEEELGEAYTQANFDGHISKPINARNLVTLLDTIVRKKEYFDIAKIRRQYVASVDEFRRLLLITAQDLPKRMEAFEAAHRGGDTDGAKAVLHGVVSILSAIGAVRAQQLIKRYRRAVKEENPELLEDAAKDLIHEVNGIKRQVKHTLGEL